MDKHVHNSCVASSDDSDEDESEVSEQCSPRINVTDDEDDKNVQHSSGECGKFDSPTTEPRGNTQPCSPSPNISHPLLSNIGALSNNTNTQLYGDDLKQLENDKKAVYSHPLFPLLALLFEKCEVATRSLNAFDSDPSLSAFNNEIEEFIEHQQKVGKPFFTNNPEVDSLMVRSIQVFRIHLLELEKVSELCKDFCKRYTSCLKSKMRSEILLRGNSENGPKTNVELELSHSFHSSSASSASSVSSVSTSPSLSCSSPSPSVHCSPPSSPSLSSSSVRSAQLIPSDLASLSQTGRLSSPPYVGINFEQVIQPFLQLSKFNLFDRSPVENVDSNQPSPVQLEDNMVAHDLSLKKQITRKPNISDSTKVVNPESVTTDKESETCDVSENERKVVVSRTKKQVSSDKPCSGHSKRGVLPKQATSIMRSWLFQHIVHPYPTEDEKRTIASQTNLTLLQVNNWFINARRRILQPMLDSANTMHHELIAGNVAELDLSASPAKSSSMCTSKKLKTTASSQQALNRFWPQSLTNIIQTAEFTNKS